MQFIFSSPKPNSFTKFLLLRKTCGPWSKTWGQLCTFLSKQWIKQMKGWECQGSCTQNQSTNGPGGGCFVAKGWWGLVPAFAQKQSHVDCNGTQKMVPLFVWQNQKDQKARPKPLARPIQQFQKNWKIVIILTIIARIGNQEKLESFLLFLFSIFPRSHHPNPPWQSMLGDFGGTKSCFCCKGSGNAILRHLSYTFIVHFPLEWHFCLC